jgi:hypothetical protein
LAGIPKEQIGADGAICSSDGRGRNVHEWDDGDHHFFSDFLAKMAGFSARLQLAVVKSQSFRRMIEF